MVREEEVMALRDKAVTVLCTDGRSIDGLTLYDWQPDTDEYAPEAVLLRVPGTRALMEVRTSEIASITAA